MTTETDPAPQPRYPDVDYSALPEHMRDGARDYIELGYEPGSFLYAVLANDLVEAFGRADATNSFYMSAWAAWLYNDAPRACWGSHARVTAWLALYESKP